MDKNAIKKFAVWARRELISRVSQRAAWYGITEKDPIDDEVTVVHGKVLTDSEQGQRRALIARIRKEGYQQVMEEVAYTWFNRFIALRFMEVNGYLPSYTRVFSDNSGAFNPQILKDAIHLDLDGLDMEKVYALEEADETEALFKYLVITQCNDLYRMLPGMFQKIADYTELLFPDFLLREGSVAHQMVSTIPEEDWKDAVQIIGWLYQYYNTEPNELVYDGTFAKNRISKELVPAATTIYTPDWAVRYMVENSLGRLWIEGHPNDELKTSWKYYLEEAPQDPDVEQQLSQFRAEYAQIDPASILCADPCMGSGHILVYMFDVLMQIYLAYGYTTNEAVESIVRNNLWGMDIDDRAAQMAYFAVMMKAQQYDHRWLVKQLRHQVQPNVFALQDSGNWAVFESQMRQAFIQHPSLMEDTSIKTAKKLFDTFSEAKECGSIIQPEITLDELNILEKALNEMAQKADLMDFVAQADAMVLIDTLAPLIQQCKGLVNQYHVVITNPPYLGSSRFSNKLDSYVKEYYPDEKSDLSMVMFRQAIDNLVRDNAFVSFITTSSWMFLASFEKLRNSLFSQAAISSLVDFGTELFEGKVGHNPIVSWVTRKTKANYKMTGIRLVEYCYSRRDEKETQFFNVSNRYTASQSDFSQIPGSPVAYWVSPQIRSMFTSETIGSHYEVRAGISSGDNTKYLRLWHEINFYLSSLFTNDYLYAPHNKGGEFRRWYGNREYMLRYSPSVIREMEKGAGFRHDGREYYFRPHITWSKITSYKSSFRYYESGFTFDSAGLGLFPKNDEPYFTTMALLNSNVIEKLIGLLNPTLNVTPIIVKQLPFLYKEDRIEQLAKDCVELSKSDWDSFETSWDFQCHPIVCFSRGIWDATAVAANIQKYYGKLPDISCPLEICYLLWQGMCNDRFSKLKANEEELNRIFIDVYGLQNELTPNVDDKDITVRKADRCRDIRSLISYAVGCMMGRYSLDKDGLVLAGQKFTDVYAHNPEGYQYGDLTTLDGDYIVNDAEKKNYTKCSFAPDRDGILPITDDEYFDDDIVGMFVNWVRTVFGADSLEDNLKYIADALGGKGNPRDVIRQYFLNDFYKDHLKIYQKRPIYWLFDSGKKNSFKCLIYMHRYQPDTIARIRTDYVHETQARYRTAIETLERESANASTGERVKLQKRVTNLKAQAEELRVYEEKIHHLADQMIPIDLDDGVKVNYAKFADVLAPIK